MIIDKTIGVCIVCENSWFCRKDKKTGKLLLPVKCPACSSPNWNKKRTGKYINKNDSEVHIKGNVFRD